MVPKVLVCDDEEAISELVSFNLARAGFKVTRAGTAAACLEILGKERVNLLILDIMLPDGDGFQVYRDVQRIRRTPVIFLTARDDEVDRVIGLELGADDYVTKPFSPRELVARAKAVLRRAAELREPEASGVIEVGSLSVDLAACQVRRGGRPLNLTRREFDVLALLARNPGRTLSREQILERVWGHDYFGEARVVDVHVRHLREKVEDDPARPRLIKTVRGFGYRLER